MFFFSFSLFFSLCLIIFFPTHIFKFSNIFLVSFFSFFLGCLFILSYHSSVYPQNMRTAWDSFIILFPSQIAHRLKILNRGTQNDDIKKISTGNLTLEVCLVVSIVCLQKRKKNFSYTFFLFYYILYLVSIL